MKKHYLIDATTMLAVWVGNSLPDLQIDRVVCEDETFLCFNSNNSLVAECEEVADFAQYKYRLVGSNLILNPEWVEPTVDLSLLKAEKNKQINEWRAEANLTTFTHLGKQIACDALSRSDIEGVAGNISLMGSFPAGFPNAWKTTDNGHIPLPNIEAFKAMYSSMTEQGSFNFAHSQDLKLELASATTIEQINAIVW